MGITWELKDWGWGLLLIALTTAVHTLGVVMMAVASLKLKARMENQSICLRDGVLIVVCVIGTVGLLLTMLHGIEYAIWAAAYMWVGAFDTLVKAMLYSIDSMTTRGASGLMLPPNWRLMGALEAADGMLLFGISTAYIFAVMQSWWSLLKTHRI